MNPPGSPPAPSTPFSSTTPTGPTSFNVFVSSSTSSSSSSSSTTPSSKNSSTSPVQSFDSPQCDDNDNIISHKQFKHRKALGSRQGEVQAIRTKFPSKIPIRPRPGVVTKFSNGYHCSLFTCEEFSIAVDRNLGFRSSIQQVIVERFDQELSLPRLQKSKFLVPQELSMSQLITVVRNRLQLSSTQAIFLMVNNRSIASLSKTCLETYREYRDPDGFLYVTYASQEAFGSHLRPPVINSNANT